MRCACQFVRYLICGRYAADKNYGVSGHVESVSDSERDTEIKYGEEEKGVYNYIRNTFCFG